MASFWSTSDGEKATGEVVESSGFNPVPRDWYTSMLESLTVDEYQGQKKIKIKSRVVGDGPFKNRVLFLGLKCWDDDEAKRDRAIQILVKMFNILGVKLPKGEPDDDDLADLVDKPIDLMIDEWEMEVNGETKSGNWLVNVEAKGTKAGGAAKPADKPAAKQPSSKSTSTTNDSDDDIPFN
jgi:hypothetical protein